MAAAQCQNELFDKPGDPPAYQQCLAAVDHLGFRTARDWLADQFFPGFASGLTRARYFYFIPWVLKELERRGLTGKQLLQELRHREGQLIHGLITTEPGADGIIGREAEENLRLMPSALYWRGLRLLGICRFQGSLEEFAARLHRNRLRGSRPLFVEEEPLEYGNLSSLWCTRLPPCPSGFPGAASLTLSTDEADDLARRILLLFPDSMSAMLLQRSEKRLLPLKFWSPTILDLLDERLRKLAELACVIAHCRRGIALVAALHGESQKLTAGQKLHEMLEYWRQKAAAEMPPEIDPDALHRLLRATGLSPAQLKLAAALIPRLLSLARGEPGTVHPDAPQLFQPIVEAAVRFQPRNRDEQVPGRDDLSDFRWNTARGILNEIIEHRSGMAKR